MTGLEEQLAGIVGDEHVLRDRDLLASYETDWTRRFSGRARCVVRPATTDETAGVVAACATAGAAVVPQGGNTGLVGGGVPRGGEVVVSTSRLLGLEPVDLVAGAVTAGAGVRLRELQEHALRAGCDFGVDMASRDSATVGGMVATNAGGMRVVRHGPMRSQLTGIEAVFANGSVVSRLSGVAKESAGYDLCGLLVGSEGTLGIVTRVRLRLVALLPSRATALVGVRGMDEAMAVLAAVRRLPSLESAEFFFEEGMDLVIGYAGLERPFAGHRGGYVLVECAGLASPAEGLASVLAAVAEVQASALATDRAGRGRLWAYRERHTEAINAAGVPVKLDVAVPAGSAAAFERELRSLVGRLVPEARLILFGHLAEANFHVNILGLPEGDESVPVAVLELVAENGGTISSEHGVGRAKAGWLGLTRGTADVAAQRAIKQALDPSGVLNPGVIFPSRASGR